MTFYFVAFTSRNSASMAYQRLCDMGVVCALFSTPTSANVGCGLSIRFNPDSLLVVRKVCSQVARCVGFFRGTRINQKIVVTRL